MYRTSIVLPDHLRATLERKARELGVSIGEIIRQALLRWIANPNAVADKDSLLSSETTFTQADFGDVAKYHDYYLDLSGVKESFSQYGQRSQPKTKVRTQRRGRKRT